MLTHASEKAQSVLPETRLSHTQSLEKYEGHANIYMQTVQTLMNLASTCNYFLTHQLHRGPYMSVHVLLNLLNELGKRDKMRGLLSISSLFRNEFNKFNNTRARM